MLIPVALVYPFDPLGIKIRGIQTFIKGFIRHAPDNFEIWHVGVTSSPNNRPVGQWMTLELGKNTFRFHAVAYERDENRKTLIPLSLRFSLRLGAVRKNLVGRVLLFNRLEPTLRFRRRAMCLF